jgi:hypothetical protein
MGKIRSKGVIQKGIPLCFKGLLKLPSYHTFEYSILKSIAMKPVYVLSLAYLFFTSFIACKGGEKKADENPAAAKTEQDTAPEQKTETPSFEKSLSLQGITFMVQTRGEGSIRQLTVNTRGLEGGDAPFELEIDGSVANAEVEDLDSDGYPELLIYTISAGSGSYGNLIAFSVLSGQSMVPVVFPDIADSPEVSEGYMGHDEFAVVETTLSRRFPIYKEGDPNSTPSGGTRQIAYKMEAGENAPVFRIHNITDY